jgi:hypothetical protein
VAATFVVATACGLTASGERLRQILAAPSSFITPWTLLLVAIQWPLARVLLDTDRPERAALGMGAANAALSLAERVTRGGLEGTSVLMIILGGATLALGLALLFAPFLLAVHGAYRRQLFGGVDRALIASGTWIACAFLLFVMLPFKADPLVVGLGAPLAGLVAGVGATVSLFRRRWLARVRRGQVPGWLIERDSEGEHLVRVLPAGESYREMDRRVLIARVS